MKQLDLLAGIANQLQVDPSPDADDARIASINKLLVPRSGPATAAALSSAVWKPTFKEFHYAHRLAPKVTSQT